MQNDSPHGSNTILSFRTTVLFQTSGNGKRNKKCHFSQINIPKGKLIASSTKPSHNAQRSQYTDPPRCHTGQALQFPPFPADGTWNRSAGNAGIGVGLGTSELNQHRQRFAISLAQIAEGVHGPVPSAFYP